MNGRGRKRDCVALTRRVPLAPAAGLLKRKMKQGAMHLCFYAPTPCAQASLALGPGHKKTAQLRCFSFCCFAERKGFEPLVPFWSTHAFQACAFDRSAISPERTSLAGLVFGGRKYDFF